MAKWGKADFDELKQLQERLQSMESKADEFYRAAAKELAARLLYLVIPETPKGIYPISSGKKGGTLQRGWTAKTHDEAVGGSGEPSAAQGRAYAQSLPVKRTAGGYTIDVINPVMYASYVEFGHRTVNGGVVEGQYFLTRSEAILDAEKDAILQRKLYQFLKTTLG